MIKSNISVSQVWQITANGDPCKFVQTKIKIKMISLILHPFLLITIPSWVVKAESWYWFFSTVKFSIEKKVNHSALKSLVMNDHFMNHNVNKTIRHAWRALCLIVSPDTVEQSDGATPLCEAQAVEALKSKLSLRYCCVGRRWLTTNDLNSWYWEESPPYSVKFFPSIVDVRFPVWCRWKLIFGY